VEEFRIFSNIIFGEKLLYKLSDRFYLA